MRAISSAAVLGLLACVSVAEVSVSLDPRHNNVDSFRQRVKQLPRESLEVALQDQLAPMYRSGVFEHPSGAIEAVHGLDPALASRVVDVAAREAAAANAVDKLHKRQADNTTVTVTSSDIVTDHTTQIVTTTAVQTTSSSSTAAPPTSTSSSSSSFSPSSQGQSFSSTDISVVTATTTVLESSSSTDGQTSRSSETSASSRSSSPSASAVEPVSQSTRSPSTEPSSSTATGVLVPVEISTTNAEGQTTVQTTSAFQPSASASIEQPVTSTNAQGVVTTATQTLPAAVITSTNSDGRPVTTTAPLRSVEVAGGTIVNSGPIGVTTTDSSGGIISFSALSSGEVVTATNSAGHEVIVTYDPTDNVVSEIVLRTTRLSNGQLSTITSFEVVGLPPPTSTANNAGPTNSANSDPHLATDGAAPAASGRYAAEIAVLIGAALGLAAAF